MALELINIKQPFDVSFTGNPIHYVFVITPYGTSETTQSTQLQVNVFVEQTPNSEIFLKVKSQIFFPSTDGLVEFDLRAYIDPYLSLTKIQPNLSIPISCDSHSCRFKISYQLMQNNAAVTSVTESAALIAIKGGLPYEQWHPSEFFSELIANQKKALNYETVEELVGKDDTRLLYWIYPYDDFAEQTVTVVVTFSDGTTNSSSYTATVSTFIWGVCCMPVGYNRMNLDSLIYGGKDIVSYTYSVKNADAIVIVTRTYIIDYRTFYRTEQLLYRNSLGALETIRLRGQIDYEADYTRQNAIRITVPAYFTDGILNNQNSNYFNEETEKKVGDTGFLSKSAQQKIRALFLAEEIYELYGDKLLPVTISSANAKFYSNRDSLISIQIEWKKAYSNQFYLPLDTMPVSRTCPNLQTFIVRQINRGTLRFMWAMPLPYDKIEIIVKVPKLITVPVLSIGYDFITTILQGNSGVYNFKFNNPNTSPLSTDTMDIQIKSRVICDEFAAPMKMGAQQTTVIAVRGPSEPIARDDYFTITSGYGVAVALPTSVMANDEDPDDEGIEVRPSADATMFGGSYSINAAGMATYTPPSSVFIGQDWFRYTIQKITDHSLTDIAKVYINVTNGIIAVWAKIIDTGTGSARTVTIHYYSNSAGTVAVDITGFGLTVNYNKLFYYSSAHVTPRLITTNLTVNPSGSTTLISTGESTGITYALTAGTGYTAI